MTAPNIVPPDFRWNLWLLVLEVGDTCGGIDEFHGLHTEGNIAVHGAEFAAVVGAALRDLDKRPRGPIRVTIINSEFCISVKILIFQFLATLFLMSEFYARKHNPLLENRLFRFGGE